MRGNAVPLCLRLLPMHVVHAPSKLKCPVNVPTTPLTLTLTRVRAAAVPPYACGAHAAAVADVHALLPHAMVRRGSVAVFAISVNTYDFFALRAGSYSPTGRAGEARRRFACVAFANCTGKVVDCLSGVRLVPAWSNVRRIPAATV